MKYENALPLRIQLKEYCIEDILGAGSFGITYHAQDSHLNIPVAIKEYLPVHLAVRKAQTTVMPKSTTERDFFQWGMQRFLDEARNLARFNHPNIVRIKRFFEANGTAYMVMDYEAGETLGDWLGHNGTAPSEEELKAIFLPILDGLCAVHKARLLHRDIKPNNIYLRSYGNPMLIDFGAARLALGLRSLSVVVTEGYAPKEQYASRGRLGAWSDLYALGASLYRCISGEVPPGAMDRAEAKDEGEPDPLKSLVEVGRGRYSEEFLRAIDEAMAFLPKDRPQTVQAFQQKLIGKGESVVLPPVQTKDVANGFFRDIDETVAVPPKNRTQTVSAFQQKLIGEGETVVLPPVQTKDTDNGFLRDIDKTVAAPPKSRTQTVRAFQQKLIGKGESAVSPPVQAKGINKHIWWITILVLMLGVGIWQLDRYHERQQEALKQRRVKDDAAYEAAKQAETVSALNQYLSGCELTGCVHGSQAKDLLARLKSERERPGMSAEHDAAYGRAQHLGTETAIKAYLSACGASGCVHKDEAEHVLAELEREQQVKEETERRMSAEDDAAYGRAQRLGTETAIKAYLSECGATGCVHKDEAEHVLAELEREQQVKEETERMRMEELARQQALEHQKQASIAKISQPRMVALPGGSFHMGNLSSAAISKEKPVHRVKIKPFLMSKYEVTFEQYDEFAKATGRKKPSDEGWGRGKRPVINVSWVDAVAYVKWLSAETNKRYRLPTESEWEYAARAGSTTKYYWGDEIGINRANCGDCGSRWDYEQTAPVGSFMANEFGLSDMHGNVWEWTQDCWNESYNRAPIDGNAWESGDCDRRVVRGGSWGSLPWYLRSANRYGWTASDRFNKQGFRLAQDH